MQEIFNFQNFIKAAPVIKIEDSVIRNAGVDLYLKREDLIHERVSGNKWRKLKYNLMAAKKAGQNTLITFGGAYSNHIAALAEAGAIFEFKTLGIIRGEVPATLNPTLTKAKELGMDLLFVSRSAYRDKATVIKNLPALFDQAYVIPEGGTNQLALQGCGEIISTCDFDQSIDFWCTACGTGGTAAGMITALEAHQKLIGFSVLKGDFMEQTIKDLLAMVGCEKDNWLINQTYHFGGYAKFNQDLIDFINTFKADYNIRLDPIYTGKLLFGIFDLIKKGYFPSKTKIMAVHTGGLQGIEGFNARYGSLIQ